MAKTKSTGGAAFPAGDYVTVQGIYRVHHAENHTEPHDLICLKGEQFPPCSECGKRAIFELIHEAPAVGQHRFFP